MRRELGIARCGLACCLCSKTECPGCHSDGCKDKDWCENRKCSMEKGLGGCIDCPEACRKGLLGGSKAYGFLQFARRYGEAELLDCLERGEKAGLVYHREGFTGDYDGIEDLEELFFQIRTGKR